MEVISNKTEVKAAKEKWTRRACPSPVGIQEGIRAPILEWTHSGLGDGQPGGWADGQRDRVLMLELWHKVRQNRIILLFHVTEKKLDPVFVFFSAFCILSPVPFLCEETQSFPKFCFDHKHQKVWHCLVGREKKDSAFFPWKLLVFWVFYSLFRTSSLKNILSHDGSRDKI